MFINCKKNVVISDGKQKHIIPKDFIGEVPKWVENNWYFKALCNDSSITSIVGTRDKAVEAAEAKAKATADKAAETAAKKAADDEAKAKAAAGGGPA